MSRRVKPMLPAPITAIFMAMGVLPLWFLGFSERDLNSWGNLSSNRRIFWHRAQPRAGLVLGKSSGDPHISPFDGWGAALLQVLIDPGEMAATKETPIRR